MANVQAGHAVAQLHCYLDLSGPWILRKYECSEGTETMDLDRPFIDVSKSTTETDDMSLGDGKRARSQSEQSNRTAGPNKEMDKTPTNTRRPWCQVRPFNIMVLNFTHASVRIMTYTLQDAVPFTGALPQYSMYVP